MDNKTVEIKLSQTNFSKGLRYAKQYGGRYNPVTKTWAIPAGRPELRAAGAYGWVLVQPAGRCPYYVSGQGCPLHGEACR